MKRLAVIGPLILSLFLITGLAYAEEKIVYVDLSLVVNKYKKTKEYDKILDKKQKVYERDREKKVDEVKRFQDKLSLLSEEERVTRRSELEDKIVQLQEFDRDSSQDLRKQRDEKLQAIFKDINKVIDDYAKKEGITLIFDKRALVYENENLDITDQIIKILNK